MLLGLPSQIYFVSIGTDAIRRWPASAALLEGPKLSILTGHVRRCPLKGEGVDDPFSGCRGKRCGELGVLQYLRGGRGCRLGIVGRHQDCRLVAGKNLAGAAHVGGDYGQSAGRPFKQYPAQGFLAGGMDQERELRK